MWNLKHPVTLTPRCRARSASTKTGRSERLASERQRVGQFLDEGVANRGEGVTNSRDGLAKRSKGVWHVRIGKSRQGTLAWLG